MQTDGGDDDDCADQEFAEQGDDPVHVRQERNDGIYCADSGSGGQTPAIERQGAELDRCQEQYVVDDEVDEEEGVDVNHSHVFIVVHTGCQACRNGERRGNNFGADMESAPTNYLGRTHKSAPTMTYILYFALPWGFLLRLSDWLFWLEGWLPLSFLACLSLFLPMKSHPFVGIVSMGAVNYTCFTIIAFYRFLYYNIDTVT